MGYLFQQGEEHIGSVIQNDISVKNYRHLLAWRNLRNVPYPLDEEPVKGEKGYLIPVPVNFQSLKQENDEAAKAWRYKLRNAVRNALSEGYTVTGVLKNSNTHVHFYILENENLSTH